MCLCVLFLCLSVYGYIYSWFHHLYLYYLLPIGVYNEHPSLVCSFFIEVERKAGRDGNEMQNGTEGE